jgi:hypothetical protein
VIIFLEKAQEAAQLVASRVKINPSPSRVRDRAAVHPEHGLLPWAVIKGCLFSGLLKACLNPNRVYLRCPYWGIIDSRCGIHRRTSPIVVSSRNLFNSAKGKSGLRKALDG